MTFYQDDETRTFDLSGSTTYEWSIPNALTRKTPDKMTISSNRSLNSDRQMIMLASELGVHRCAIPLISSAKWFPRLVIDSVDSYSM
jgi:hypothetical protein